MIDATVEAFINSRILRYSEESDLYEISHDSLAKRIAEKRSDEEIAILEIKRLVKSQTSLKADTRELFSEKQLNFIEPFLEKLKLNEEEKTLVTQSYEAVAASKAKEKLQQEAEKQRLLERQGLLEKNQRSQKRFIGWMIVALVVMLGLALAMIGLWQKATKAAEETTIALEKIEKEQAISKARQLKSYGDSYKDLESFDNACDSYNKALVILSNYKDGSLYTELTNLKRVLQCK
jgi:tetratricopeptide (TPR) repeat protein